MKFMNFFRSTCREWLNRIRLALCVVSLHAGMASNALRNSQRLLDDLSAIGNTQGSEFERATLYTARALVLLGEAEALQGLYLFNFSLYLHHMIKCIINILNILNNILNVLNKLIFRTLHLCERKRKKVHMVKSCNGGGCGNVLIGCHELSFNSRRVYSFS